MEGAQSGQVVWQISFQSLRSLDSCFRNTYYAWGPSQSCWPGSSAPASGRDLSSTAQVGEGGWPGLVSSEQSRQAPACEAAIQSKGHLPTS